MALVVTTASALETLHLGAVLGRSIVSPLVVTLTGDLGSGKTVFVQGLAKGLEVPAEYYVTSPSYTLINEYPGRLRLYHADLYRLAGGADLEDLELLDLVSGKGVVAIEWADRIGAQELGAHLAVQIETTGATARVIHLSGAGQGRSDLLREVEKKLR
jgi:tRNA threonylcarbamoyladenosine biosynthesis protein TsaE